MTLTVNTNKTYVRRSHWFNTLIALLALINFLLVFFDINYIAWRDVYLEYVPEITKIYDPIKGIFPHPETQNYLDRVNQLESQVLQTSLQSPESEKLLARLRLSSKRLIEDNPFDVAKKTGTLAKIKNEMRLHTHETSARRGFDTFWSKDYLSQAGWSTEIFFFNSQIRPLIESNYYRNINKFGKFVNRFWMIDLPFTIIFALEFLGRSFYISRKNYSLSWLEAMLRRWYDLLLFFPLWRVMRVIPVTLRLYQANLLNLEPLRRQLNYDFAVNFAENITELVGIQVIDQMQNAIRRGDLAIWLFYPDKKPYIQVNNTDEVKAIAAHLVNVSVYNVIPQIQNDIEALIQHAIQSTLNESPVFKQIQNMPGINILPNQLTKNLARDLSQTSYKNLVKIIEDPVIIDLSGRIIKNFRNNLEQELQKQHNLEELQNLLIDMLEEIKINYVKGISLSGLEKILEEANQIQKTIYR